MGTWYVPDDDRKLEARFRMEAGRLVARRFVPFPDVASTLVDLARLNVPLAALGDGWPSVDQRVADAVGFTGTIVHATDVDAGPGAGSALDEIARRLRIPIENVWFVGTDLAREIAPAAAAGMHTIWIDRGHADISPHAPTPDATVDSFGAIRDALGEPYTRGLLALRYILRTSLAWRPGFTIATSDTFDVDEPRAPDAAPHDRPAP